MRPELVYCGRSVLGSLDQAHPVPAVRRQELLVRRNATCDDRRALAQRFEHSQALDLTDAQVHQRVGPSIEPDEDLRRDRAEPGGIGALDKSSPGRLRGFVFERAGHDEPMPARHCFENVCLSLPCAGPGPP